MSASSSAAATKRPSAACSSAGHKKSKYDTKSGTLEDVQSPRNDAPTVVPIPSSDGLPEQLAMVRWSSRLPDYLEGEPLPDAPAPDQLDQSSPAARQDVVVVGSKNGGSSAAGVFLSGKDEQKGDAENSPSRSLREHLRRLFKANSYDVRPIEKSLKYVGRVESSSTEDRSSSDSGSGPESDDSSPSSEVPNFNATITYLDGMTRLKATAEEISTKALVIVDEADVPSVLAQHENHGGALKYDTIKAAAIYRLHKIRVNTKSTHWKETVSDHEIGLRYWARHRIHTAPDESRRGCHAGFRRELFAFDTVLPSNTRLLLIAETVLMATAALSDNGHSKLTTALARAMERELVAMYAEAPRGRDPWNRQPHSETTPPSGGKMTLFQSVAAKPTEAAQLFWTKQGLRRCQTVCSLNARADTDDEKKVKEWLQKNGGPSFSHEKDFEGLLWKSRPGPISWGVRGSSQVAL